MTQYGTLNINLTKSQFNKFKSGIKDDAEVILNLSLNMVKVSNDETNFPQNFFLTDTQVSRLCKAFVNG